jgi:hypothetical protein
MAGTAGERAALTGIRETVPIFSKKKSWVAANYFGQFTIGVGRGRFLPANLFHLVGGGNAR